MARRSASADMSAASTITPAPGSVVASASVVAMPSRPGRS